MAFRMVSRECWSFFKGVPPVRTPSLLSAGPSAEKPGALLFHNEDEPARFISSLYLRQFRCTKTQKHRFVKVGGKSLFEQLVFNTFVHLLTQPFPGLLLRFVLLNLVLLKFAPGLSMPLKLAPGPPKFGPLQGGPPSSVRFPEPFLSQRGIGGGCGVGEGCGDGESWWQCPRRICYGFDIFFRNCFCPSF